MVQLLIIAGFGVLVIGALRYQWDFLNSRRYKRGEIIHDDSEDDND